MPAHDPTAYFHGLPGGPTELALFGPAPDWASAAFTPDRTADRPDLLATAYFDDLAARAAVHSADRRLHLVGFSLGARVAIEVAERLGPKVSRIDLISPAGPLDGNDHLKLMAGKAVFRMARSAPHLFALQTAAQGWIARNRPGMLYRALFGPTGEIGLDDPQFRLHATKLLHDGFLRGSAGYRREVLAYVSPWSHVVRRVHAPTTIWQGSADSWTPPPMAKSLCALLPQPQLRILDGKGHYGALRHALSQIAAG